MKKIIEILLLTILCVLFASCGEKNIDMNKIQVSINNNQYKICEDIIIRCEGDFNLEDKVVNAVVYMCLMQIDSNGEKISENCKLNIISRNGEDINWQDEAYSFYLDSNDVDNSFYYEIKDTIIRNIDETIVVSIPNIGVYDLFVELEASSQDKYLGGIKSFHHKIIINE